MIIEQYCIPRGVWIDHYENKSTQSEMLMKKIVSTTKYDIDLPDWDMNHIKQVEETYGKVSRIIQLRKQELLANQPDAPTAQAATLFKKPHPAPSQDAYPSQDVLIVHDW